MKVTLDASDRALVLFTLAAMTVLVASLLFVVPALALPKPECIGTGGGLSRPTGCVIATYPDPVGGTVDFCDWMAPAPDLRDVTYMKTGKIAGHVVQDKIIYTKFSLAGDNWDSWTFDEDYIYFYSTGSVTDFVKAPTEHDTPWLPRYAQLGFPGVRLVVEGSHWQKTVACEPGPVSPSSNSIMEVWGPTTKTYADNIGTVEIVTVKTWWDCWTTDAMSCTQEEDYAYAKPYGWIEWEHFTAPNRDGVWQWLTDGGAFGDLEHGDSVIHDWCFSTSIFASPLPVHQTINLRNIIPFHPIKGPA